jgi:hypothetical protein
LISTTAMLRDKIILYEYSNNCLGILDLLHYHKSKIDP